LRTTIASLLACLLSMFVLAGLVSAHVTVMPKETTQGAYEVITVRVPSEKESATVKLELKVPEDINVSRLEPKPGWHYELIQDGDGKITDIVWTADGEGFSSTEFGEFKLQGKVGAEAGALVWKAYQYYQDGTKVEWTGAADSDTPAPVMQAKPKVQNAPADAADSAASGEKSNSRLPLCLSIAALVLAAAALALSIRRRRERRSA